MIQLKNKIIAQTNGITQLCCFYLISMCLDSFHSLDCTFSPHKSNAGIVKFFKISLLSFNNAGFDSDWDLITLSVASRHL